MIGKCIDLAGMWQMTSLGEHKYCVDATIPGDTHTALLNAGIIEEPYYASNEAGQQWIGREDWEFSREFTIDSDVLSARSIFLVAEQIDTLSEILINGQLVGKTESMFIHFCSDVKPYLTEGVNTLAIRIFSAENAAIEKAKNLPYPIPMSQYPIQSPYRNLIRKVGCHAGWDWGPCLMVAGIYDSIYLQPVNEGRIEYVMTTQEHTEGKCELLVECEVRAVADFDSALRVSIGDNSVEVPVSLAKGINKVCVRLNIDNPQLWWPAGQGQQPLYEMSVEVAGDSYKRKLGLRKMELVYEEDEIGLSLKVRVNGRDIFCKGSNWIPCDAMPSRQAPEVYCDLLNSAVQANMNMIRVWGGGQYEKDVFYQLCDELGLMVWQDFMFACALHPADRDFLKLVRQEAEHQVKRLRDYACIALWCGNNENLAAMRGWQESRNNRDRYLVDYDRLNEGVLGDVVHEFDPQRVFWSSSPCGGPGDYSNCFHNDNRGDMHYWQVWHSGKSFEAYYDVTPRFCSEFGFQSFPWLETVKTYAPDDQFNVTAPVMEHHQRNPGGNSKITEMFTRYFRMPEGFENFTYLSQVQQALAIKTGVEHWRHLQPVCMGTIIWQLNDNWPVASWSSIDYGGKWKLMHYAAKRFYAPAIVSAFQSETGELEIWLTSELNETILAQIKIQIYSLDGEVIKEEMITADTPVMAAILLKKVSVDDFVEDCENCFMRLELSYADTVFVNEHFFCKPKRLNFPSANVSAKVSADGEEFIVELTTDKPAFYVTANAAGIKGEFDDNMILLMPQEKRKLVFTPKQAITIEQFEQALEVTHLRKAY